MALTLISPLTERPGLAAELLALWVGVTRAGGAVGFVVESPAELIEAAVAATMADLGDGRLHGVGLAQDQRLVGVGFLVAQPPPVCGHRATVVRLMVHPDLQRGGHGSRLLTALVDRARELRFSILLLGARGGTGAAEFYARNGWSECGRVERSLRVDRPDGGTDWCDDISFALRLA